MSALAAHIAAEGARLAALCSACGACVRACPMTPYAPMVAEAGVAATAAGMRDVLLGGPGSPAAIAWIGVCNKNGLCTPACPEGLPAALMLKYAQMRLKGALGEPPRLPAREDPQFAAKVKAFARLTLTDQEQATWL